MYVGGTLPNPAGTAEPHHLIEVNLSEGCFSAPLSKYARYNTRICRPVGLLLPITPVLTDHNGCAPRKTVMPRRLTAIRATVTSSSARASSFIQASSVQLDHVSPSAAPSGSWVTIGKICDQGQSRLETCIDPRHPTVRAGRQRYSLGRQGGDAARSHEQSWQILGERGRHANGSGRQDRAQEDRQFHHHQPTSWSWAKSERMSFLA